MFAMLKSVSSISHLPEFDSHKAVYRFEDVSVGLSGFIAIHNENLGPATGGTRMYPYPSEREALADVLRLSRAMTYKCAIAGVRHGGAKAVIIGNPDTNKAEALLRAYARIVNELKGRFTTGEDVGITEDDVQVMFEESSLFNVRKELAGDPSPDAALSTFYAMQVAVSELFGSEKIAGRTVALKGIGKVGSRLLTLLIEVGAQVTAADIKDSVTQSVREKFPQVKLVGSEKIHLEPADIFSPCALGGDLSAATVNVLPAKIICGAANNQLASPEAGDLLSRRDIAYVPDYVANAGGLINVMDEREAGGYNRERVLNRILNLKNTLRAIFQLSRVKHAPMSRVADELAEDIFNGKRSNGVV